MANRIRITRSKNFTNISNEMLSDKRLSYRARWLLSYILTKPDKWSFNNTDICNKSTKEWRDAIDKAKKELKELRYLIINRTNDNKWKIIWDWIISDTPYTENQWMVNQWLETHTLKTTPYSNTNSNTKEVLSKDNTNEDVWSSNNFDWDLEKWNEETPPPIPSTPPSWKKQPNEEVNEIIKVIREKVEWLWFVYDNTDDRTFAWQLLRAKKFIDTANSVKMDSKAFAIRIIELSIELDYWKKILWPKLIYKHFGEIYSIRVAQKKKDPVKAYLDNIQDEKLKAKMVVEVENRRFNKQVVDVWVLERMEERLSGKKLQHAL